MFSLLMSVYANDSPSYLRDAFVSIVNQSVKPEEVILVVDGPIGVGLESVPDEYSSVFERIKLQFSIHRISQNIGLGSALQYGSQFCKFEYIVRFDSDDICAEDRIKVLKAYLLEHPDTDVLGTYIQEFNFDPLDATSLREVPLTLDSIKKYSKKRNPMNHVTVCIRKSALDKVGGYEDVLYHEDYYLWLKMIMSDLKLVNIPVVTVLVRIGNDMIGRRKGMEYFQHEFSFVRKAIALNSFTYINGFTYLFPRFFLRLLSASMLTAVYKYFLRS